MTELHDCLNFFCDLLQKRFGKTMGTTEDAIRYTFFHAITTKMNIDPHNVELESLHPNSKSQREQIDAIVHQSDKVLVFEFKYHRKLPKNRSNVTDKAGQVFYDIFRLARYKKSNPTSRCFFVYVSDSMMADYFKNKKNTLDDFFDLEKNTKLTINKEYLKNKSITFLQNCGEVYECILYSYFKKEIKSHFIKIYEIETKL